MPPKHRVQRAWPMEVILRNSREVGPCAEELIKKIIARKILKEL